MPYNISEKAMLATLQIRQWPARKHDNYASREVNAQYGSKADTGRFNKVMASIDVLKDIQMVVDSARAFHLEQTLPWGDRGERLLPGRNHSAYARQIRDIKTEFETAVENFAAGYPELIFEARRMPGRLLDREGYPEVSEIRGKFAFRTVITPVPEVVDFRVNLAADEVAAIQREIEEHLAAANAEATRDLWQRLLALVGHMVERLSDPDTVFRNSIVSNILSLTELTPRLNLYDDPQLEAMHRQIESDLCRFTPEELRRDHHIRQQTAQAVQGALDAMNGYMEAA